MPSLRPGHDHWECSGQRNCPECVPTVRFIVTSDVQIDLVDFKHPGRGVDHQRIEHSDCNHEDFRAFTEAEDKQRERQDGALRHRVGGGNERIEQGADRPIKSHDNAEYERGKPAEQRAIGQSLQADRGVGDKLARAHHLDKSCHHGRRRRKKSCVDGPKPRAKLPDGQQRER